MHRRADEQQQLQQRAIKPVEFSVMPVAEIEALRANRKKRGPKPVKWGPLVEAFKSLPAGKIIAVPIVATPREKFRANVRGVLLQQQDGPIRTSVIANTLYVAKEWPKEFGD